MTRRPAFALPLLLLLAACNRRGVADVTLDADAAQRNATAAKTVADLAAADAASRGPAPAIEDARPPAPEPPATDAPDQAPPPEAPDEALTNE